MERFARELLRGFSIAEPGSLGIYRTKMHWLIRLRTVAIITQALALIPGVQLGLIATSRIVPYILVVGALTGFNALALFWVHQCRSEPDDRAVFTHLTVDLIGFTALLNLSGGWQNPFISLYFLHTGLGALLLQRVVNVVFLALVMLGFTVTFSLTEAASHSIWPPLLPGTTILCAEIFVALLIWTLTSWLAVTFRKLNQNVQVLREQNSRLDRLRAVGAIAAGFSHQLATPLNTIKMRLERVVRQGATHPVHDDAHIALQNVARCEGILRSYFVERLEPERLALEPTEMVALTERVCKSWLLDHPITYLRFKSLRGLQLYCQISPVEFSCSLIDLLDNAQEAQTQRVPEIVVTVRPVGREVEIRIDDSGPGFPTDVLARVGEPFLTAKVEGAGLGLFTAFALTQSLSGQFIIQNKATGGGRVMMRLPLLRREMLYDASTPAHFDC